MEAVDVLKIIMALTHPHASSSSYGKEGNLPLRTLVAAMHSLPRDSNLMLQACRALIDSVHSDEDVSIVSRSGVEKNILDFLRANNQGRQLDTLSPSLFRFIPEYIDWLAEGDDRSESAHAGVPQLFYLSHLVSDFHSRVGGQDPTPCESAGPPKTGGLFPLLHPPPFHSLRMPNYLEQCFIPRENLITHMLLAECRRLSFSEDVIGKLVFDSMMCCSRLDEGNVVNLSSTDGKEAMYGKALDETRESLLVTRQLLSARPGFGNNIPFIPDTALETNRLPPSPYYDQLPPCYTLSGSGDTSLLFESRFESGNLRRAVRVYPFEYDLVLNPDINSYGNTQWFYFSVANTRVGRKYKFNILNMLKPDSMFNYGMKPLVYSEAEHKRSGLGWHRAGDDICYYRNFIKARDGYHYTLTFTIEFQHNRDTCSIAMCYPYTYTYLQRYLSSLEADPTRKQLVCRTPMCKTLAGNTCDLLTITSPTPDPNALKRRKAVVLSARVHPGETNASWMMHGIIDYLCGPSIGAQILRDNFVFKIVPMLNPDGVINGNYRCSFLGVDLNRQWHNPCQVKHPTVFYTKKMIKDLSEEREVVMYCDLHGHSRKHNVFIYGCGPSKVSSSDRIQERVFPYMYDNNSEHFSYEDCDFKVVKAKENTARVVVWKEFGITNSYTLEASFFGPNRGENQATHFNTHHYQEVGHQFCETILDRFFADEYKINSYLRDIEQSCGLEANDSDCDSDADGVIKKKKSSKKSSRKKNKGRSDKKEKKSGKK